MSTQRFLNTTNHTVSWFEKRFRADELTLKAPFQRNPVWTDRQKAYLIDTILHGYPIPELYMQEFTDENGSDRHVVVDGQQRVRACLEFLDGAYTLDGRDSPDWADFSFDDLSAEQKKQVYGYNLVVRVLPEMPQDELRAMFARLNRNVVALNPQELRHATYWGPFIKTMEDIADQELWGEFGVFTPNDVRRMLDVEFVSELAVAVLHGMQNKKQTLEKFYGIYESEFDQEARIRSVFRETLGELRMVLPDLVTTRWRKKSDFYTLFLVFAEHLVALPLSREQRALASEALRTFAASVDSLLTLDAKPHGQDPLAIDYAQAVERAASDLQNRVTRRDAVSKLLEPVFAGDA